VTCGTDHVDLPFYLQVCYDCNIIFACFSYLLFSLTSLHTFVVILRGLNFCRQFLHACFRRTFDSNACSSLNAILKTSSGLCQAMRDTRPAWAGSGPHQEARVWIQWALDRYALPYIQISEIANRNNYTKHTSASWEKCLVFSRGA